MGLRVALLSCLATLALGGAAGAQNSSTTVEEFLTQHMDLPAASAHERVQADLNDDGVPEEVVYLTSPDYCGTGGCTLLILQRSPSGLRLVSRTTIVRPPIRLLPTRTKGWRDLVVKVAGGGGPTREVRLRFDGRGYPLNPSLQPAAPAPDPRDRTLIPAP